MTCIRELFGQRRSEQSVVARRFDAATRNSREITWGEFRLDVANLGSLLETHESGAWVLLTEDAYAFAVGLFALWHTGSHAILPPNRQPEALAELKARSLGTLSDLPELFASGSSIHPLEVGGQASSLKLATLKSDAIAVELFTSGTTGDEKPVRKQISHLEQELFQLETCWGNSVKGSTFIATASHQHLYGLLFGVLWPLCFERAFETNHYLHAGELIPRICETEDCVLASVPTSLKRLAQHAGANALADHCRVVFSSGGPLASETAHAIFGILGHAPIEVLGSTETGGIAWRAQEPESGEATWTPFPCVRISREQKSGGLLVHSPLVSVESTAEGYSTGDFIELMPDDRFRLLGRSNQIVKVAEKRLDLTLMTRMLQDHEWLSDAALTTIERDSESRVAAVVVASQLGLATLDRDGRHAFTRGLRSSLATSFDPVLHPRYWRIRDGLPENAQGKLTREAIRGLFETRTSVVGCTDRPDVLEELRGSDFIERICLVPPDLDCFAGHFPERAVVPGVLQLDWAMELLTLLEGHPPVVEEIELLKFLAPLEPRTQFRLHVRVFEIANGGSDADATKGTMKRKMEFSLLHGEEKIAVGRVRLASSTAGDDIGADS